jgi:hypothetical protein
MNYFRNLWKAIDSGWRAGIKQFRTMRSKQRTAARLDDPFAS